MDYESRKVKWYWFLLFIIYCGGVAYALFQGNPLLYARSELRHELNLSQTGRRQTIPLHPVAPKANGATFQARYGSAHTAIDPFSAPRSKNYLEYEHIEVDSQFSGGGLQNATQDASGIYLSGKSAWAEALGLDGKVRWKFRFKNLAPEQSLLPVLLSESSAYLIHPSGEVVCFDKQSGEMRWQLTLKEDVAAQPIIWNEYILLPTKSSSGVHLNLIRADNGQVGAEDIHLEIKPGFLLSWGPSYKTLIATIDNKVIAIDPGEWKIVWTMPLTDPIRGPAVVVGSQIFVATLGAKIVKLDGSKGGKREWEADLPKAPASAPAFLPIINYLSVMDTSGAIAIIDAQFGKLHSHTVTENKNPLAETWSARIKGQYIEEFKMDWLHKGWTVWSPCGESRFCIYTPKAGLLVNRVQLSGRPLTLPLALDHRWIFLTQTKAGKLMLSTVLEEGEIKKLRAAGS